MRIDAGNRGVARIRIKGERMAGTTGRGFTLVEIAIVLVIIGLLLGGVLKGQEMIAQARIKNVISDFSGISAAYYGYQDRYRAIPGDDPSTGQRWPSAVPGNGNGQVQGKYNSQTAADESRQWWDHLRRSGFVAGAGTAQPFNVLGGLVGVQNGDGGSPAGPAMGGFVSLLICSANLQDKVAIAVDGQIDDGSPNTGAVRGQLQSGANPDIAAAAASVYTETGSTVYTLCRAL
jgi:prepilin-type N-terminal cleavage/methylation domain-containing protein